MSILIFIAHTKRLPNIKNPSKSCMVRHLNQLFTMPCCYSRKLSFIGDDDVVLFHHLIKKFIVSLLFNEPTTADLFAISLIGL